jgi:hypothetical protein
MTAAKKDPACPETIVEHCLKQARKPIGDQTVILVERPNSFK